MACATLAVRRRPLPGCWRGAAVAAASRRHPPLPLALLLGAGHRAVAAGGAQPRHHADGGRQAAQPGQVRVQHQACTSCRVCADGNQREGCRLDPAAAAATHTCRSRRPKDELLEKPLGRLQKSAAPQPDRQQKRQKGKSAADGGAGAGGAAPAAAAAPPAAPFVGLHAGPSPEHPVLDAGAITNEEAWRQGRLLRIGEATYRVELNPPFVDRVELHARAFVGIPLVPAVQVRGVRAAGHGAG